MEQGQAGMMIVEFLCAAFNDWLPLSLHSRQHVVAAGKMPSTECRELVFSDV